MTKEGVKPAPVLSAVWLANYQHQVLTRSSPDLWGACYRFRFGQITLDYFPAPSVPDLKPAATLRGKPNEFVRRTKLTLPDVVEFNGVTELEPVTGYG